LFQPRRKKQRRSQRHVPFRIVLKAERPGVGRAKRPVVIAYGGGLIVQVPVLKLRRIRGRRGIG
jgi:hypothetical protein